MVSADGPAPINLGSLETNNFVVFGQTGVTDATPASTAITGNVGTSLVASPAVTGLSCTEVLGGGKIYILTTAGYAGGWNSNISCLLKDDAIVPAAVGDFTTAYNNAIAAKIPTVTELGAGTLTTQTLAPGTYDWSTNVTITGDITLSGGPNDVWIFQLLTTKNLAIQANKKILLTGGAQTKNIFWAVSGHTELFAGSVLEGNVLGWEYIALDAGATLHGRALSKTQVTLIGNNILIPIIDTTPPVITRLGSSPVTKEFGSTYTDAGATALDDVDGDITSSIVAVNPVNTSLLGVYTVTYNVSDAAGNPATQVTRTVNVVDTTLPVITRLGLATTSLVVGTVYTDAGATALDNVDGNITASIIAVNPVNKDVVGTYTVTYNVTDSSGNVAVQKTRTVNVIAAVDNVSPVITVVGSSTVSLTVGTTYTDAGATALDDIDGDITDNIVTVNPVNKDVVGTYTVTYNVSDSSGNPAVQKTRTVNVVAVITSSSGGGSRGGGTHYGCKDPNASNYEFFAASNPSLCIYNTTVTAPSFTSTTTSVITLPIATIATVLTPSFPNTGFAPEDVSVQSYILNLFENICSQRFFQ